MKSYRWVVIAVLLIAVLAVVGAFALFLISVNQPDGGGSSDVQLESVTTASWPIALGFASDGRVFFAERNSGAIRILQAGTLLPTPFYTLANTATAGERGLLGLALDPGFPATPYVYAYQTYNDAANGTVYNRIVRIQANGDTGVSHTVVLRMPPLSGATNHNGGVIAFGPDGKLYAVVGENANPSLAQNSMSVMGKVLRMNSDGSPPSDNPFYGSLSWDNLVFTYGHRNLFGIAWHPTTGRGYVTENGPSDNDEINLLTNASNYGWPNVRGIARTPPYVDPIIAYTPVIVPTNAAFYTAVVPAGSRNHLVVGSFQDHRLHELTLTADGTSFVGETTLATAPDGVLDVEMGRDGLLWLTTPSAIYRLVPVQTPAYIPPAGLAPFGSLLLAARLVILRQSPGRNFHWTACPPATPETLVGPRTFACPNANVPNPER